MNHPRQSAQIEFDKLQFSLFPPSTFFQWTMVCWWSHVSFMFGLCIEDIEVPRMSLVDNKQHDGGANDLYVQNEVIQDKNQISIHHPHPVDIMMTLQHMYAVEVAAHDRLGSEEVSIMKALSRAITLIPLPASTITNVNGIRRWQNRLLKCNLSWHSRPWYPFNSYHDIIVVKSTISLTIDCT